MRFVATEAHAGRTLDDPLASRLSRIGKSARGGAADLDLFLPLEGVFPDALKRNARFVKALADAYENVAATTPRSA